MMPDSEFFNYLGTLQNGSILKNAYNSYKKSEEENSFVLNGRLRAGLDLGNYKTQNDELNNIFRAKNNKPLTLYRMTSTTEFTPSGAEVALGLSFRYPAFLSTTRNIKVLQNFIPSTGLPVILIINCPADTVMALMEANDLESGEEEILLQSYTEYKIKKPERIECKSKIESYLGKYKSNKHDIIYLIEMDVISNSPYWSKKNKVDFYLFKN